MTRPSRGIEMRMAQPCSVSLTSDASADDPRFVYSQASGEQLFVHMRPAVLAAQLFVMARMCTSIASSLWLRLGRGGALRPSS